jgi:NADH dehydrogenase (ubiquinone) 1 beta subcomplex subunit 8
MASLLKLSRFSRFVSGSLLSKNVAPKSQMARTMAYWNKDWKPGPYPRTEKERIAAAKKYGMRPEDYQPYPDDGMGYGDYPMLPRVSAEAKDPYACWDVPSIKRNFGEPMNVDADAITEERWSPDIKYRYSFGQMLLSFFGVMGGAIFLYILAEPYPVFQPVMPKHYARDGKTHYTFEPVE